MAGDDEQRATTQHPFLRWKLAFLRRRALDGVTGMPLYSYKVSKEEFAELEGLLADRLKVYLQQNSLGDIAKHVLYFPPLFVLYAAEWWRRRYDGTGWSWEPIVESLGAPANGWSQAQRSDCVERGLAEWRLGLRDAHGLRFLGSIAFNGGLPMQLLATARGNIGRVLGRVLRLARGGSSNPEDILGWITSLGLYLPNAYRQQEIYVLLAEVILTVLRLRASASLTTATGAIAQLDERSPHWRNLFPFPVEDEQAQGLLEQLVRDAAAVRPVRAAARISLERTLEQVEDGSWQLRAELEIPEYLPTSVLAAQFSADVATLPRFLTIRVERRSTAVELSARRLAGQDKYRIDRRPLESRQVEAASVHSLALIAVDGSVWHASLTKGDALEPDLPWIFEAAGDELESLAFVRQGGGSTGGRSCWACVPQHWRVQTEGEGTCTNVGLLPGMERLVVHVSGSARFEDHAGQSYRVRTGQATAVEEQLEWRGERIWDMFGSPQTAFRGTPRLYRVSEEGFAQPAVGQIAWRWPGGRATLTPTGLFGPLEATWPAGGDIRWRSRFVVLPAGSFESQDTGHSVSAGRIRLHGWAASFVRSRVETLTCRSHNSNSALDVDLEWRGGGDPPEMVDLEVFWQGNPQPAVVRFPFPAIGAKAFDALGRQLSSGALLSVDKLAGVRVVAFLGGSHRADLELSSYDGTGNYGRLTVRREVKASAGSRRTEIRLIDYEPEIQRMLANSDALDATVALSLRPPGGPGVSLKIARYAAAVRRDPTSSSVVLDAAAASKQTPDQLSRVQLYALRLDQPGEEPFALAQIHSQSVPTGSWRVDAERFTPGPWLIFPAPASELNSRPLLWPVDGPAEVSGDLASVLRISDQAERFEALDTAIAKLSEDLAHPDWTSIERLAGHLGHLPLTSLDLWRRLARSYSGTAALVLRVGSLPARFSGRFATELPFLWELVPFSVWRAAISAVRRQCDAWYGAKDAQTIFDEHVGRRIQELSSYDRSLRVLLEAARDAATGTISRDVKVAQLPTSDALFADQLFEGEGCLLQQLMRNNAEAQWPAGFTDEVAAARRSPTTVALLCRADYGFRDNVINIPIILAVQAVTGEGPDWLSWPMAISMLRANQSFDPDWFSDAFDLTVARCLSTGLLKFEG
jgi:hypothetical protein